MGCEAKSQRQKRRLLWQEITPARGAASLTKRATFATIESTNTNAALIQDEKDDRASPADHLPRMSHNVYNQTSTATQSKHDIRKSQPERAGFFKRGLEAIKEMNRSKPHRRKRAERSARIEASATNGIHKHKQPQNKGEKRHEETSSNSTTYSRTHRSDASRRQNRQRLHRTEEHAKRILQLDHNTRRSRDVQMSNTHAGGIKARETNYQRHGRDFYKRIGAIGGRNGHTGGFAANPILASIAGAKGGRLSKRGPAKPKENQ